MTRTLAVALAAVTAVLALAGCTQPSGTLPEKDGQGRYVIHLRDTLRFDPPEARVPAGATVVWLDDGGVAHDVNGYRQGDDYPTWSSNDAPPSGLGHIVNPGQSFNHTFAPSENGSWTIYCHPHHEQGMKGALRVG